MAASMFIAAHKKLELSTKQKGGGEVFLFLLYFSS